MSRPVPSRPPTLAAVEASRRLSSILAGESWFARVGFRWEGEAGEEVECLVLLVTDRRAALLEVRELLVWDGFPVLLRPGRAPGAGAA